MLQILINDKPLELPEGCKVRLKLSNPIFVKDIGSYSFPITIRQSPYNLAVLGLVKQAPRGALIKQYDAILRYKRREIKCIATISSIEDGAVSLYFKFNKTSLNSILGDKLLTDLKIDNLHQICAHEYLEAEDVWTDFPKYANSNYDVGCVFFPVFNSKLTGCTKQDNTPMTIQNGWFQEDTIYQDGAHLPYDTERDYEGSAPGNFNLKGANLSPFFFVKYIVDVIFNEIGFRIEENILTENTAMSQMVLYSNVLWTDIAGTSAKTKEWGFIPGSIFLPNIKVIDFIHELENQLNIHFIIDTQNYTVKIVQYNDIVKSSDYRKGSPISELNFNSSEYITDYSFTCETPSDLNTSENLSADYIKTTTATTDEDSLALEIKTLFSPITKEAWITYPFRKWQFVRTNDWGEVMPDNSDGDMFYVVKRPYVKIPQRDIVCYRDIDVFEGRIIPGVTEDSNGTVYPETPLQLMIYRGVINHVPHQLLGVEPTNKTPNVVNAYRHISGMIFPYGSCIDNIFKTNDIPNKMVYYYDEADRSIQDYRKGSMQSLKWTDLYGIHERYYKQYLFWKTQRAQPITWNEQLTEDELLGFDWTQKRMINEQQCFVYEIDVEITANYINVAQMSGETL